MHRVTSQSATLDHKQPYLPGPAATAVVSDVQHYLAGRAAELQGLSRVMDRAPLLVAPFDAELFRHWWYEGPSFWPELFRQAPAQGVSFTHLRAVLADDQPLQVCRPSPSSWGQGGYHDYWVNDSNAWVVIEWQRASAAMVRRVNRGVGSNEQRQLLTQAGRELLLAQSSD